jgi:hypothetical protein
VNDLVSGILIAIYAAIALFFLRFWFAARERLFGLFALAFVVLAAQRLALSLTNAALEDLTMFYLLRLAAFVIIVVAIVDKNRR